MLQNHSVLDTESINVDTYCHSEPLRILCKTLLEIFRFAQDDEANRHSEPLGEESHANPNCHSEDEVRRISCKGESKAC